MNPLRISVIICTYNPNLQRLNKTLQGLQNQTLPTSEWELIIIDNNSDNDFAGQIDISWHIDAKIVTEPKPGLTYARLEGIDEATHEIIVMVDDDNILEKSYLESVATIFKNYTKIGAIGGKSVPLFEKPPRSFVNQFYSLLALRDLGDEIKVESLSNTYPHFAPIGAGMAFRREAVITYTEKVKNSTTILSDRKGNALSSSGDNDMVFEILKNNWQVGYFPELSLGHIIPESRMTEQYLARLNFSIQKSWAQFLLAHNLSPWSQIKSYTLPLRKLKSWLKYKAWRNETAYINWRGACGRFEGLAR